MERERDETLTEASARGDDPLSATLPQSTSAGAMRDEREPAAEELPLTSFVEGDFESAHTYSSSASHDLTALGLLGEGGMGRVHLAAQRSLRRRIAVKTANARAGSGETIIREAVITGMLEHPNIPPVHALARGADGRPVLLMKHIEGHSWAAVLEDRAHPLRAQSPIFVGSDELEASLEVLSQVCNALELAHARGIVHRDVKPDNVMLGRYGEVYLIDWGIAFNPSWHPDDAPIAIVGTASYMAPEMLARERPDPRTDVYLLGATLFRVLTGAPPHDAPSVEASLARAFEGAPPRFAPSVPTELATLCERAMKRARSERTPTVRAFREELRSYLSHRASIALAERTEARLDAWTALATNERADDAQLRALEQECRFGWAQALQDWPSNARALDGLARLRSALIQRAIVARDFRAARAVAHEQTPPAPETLAMIDDAEQRHLAALERERADDEANQRFDLRKSTRERNIVMGAALLLAAGNTVWRALHPANDHALRARHLSLLLLWLTIGALTTLTVALYWKRLRVSPVDSRIALSTAAYWIAGLAHRATGVITLPSVADMLIGDSAIAVVLGIVVGVFVHRSIAWGAAIPLLGMFAIALAPAFAGPIFNVAMTTNMAYMLWILLRETRRARERAPTRAA